MAKVRISDIAKQLGTKSNEVIRVLEEHGIDNNGKKFAPNSSVEEGVIEGLKSDIKIEKKQNTTEGKEEAHKQKIYMVSNPQNSQGFKPNRKNNNNQNQNKNNMNISTLAPLIPLVLLSFNSQASFYSTPSITPMYGRFLYFCA